MSVVDHDIVAMGRLAAERLFLRMNGDDSAAQLLTLPTRIIRRGSGELTWTERRAGLRKSAS